MSRRRTENPKATLSLSIDPRVKARLIQEAEARRSDISPMVERLILRWFSALDKKSETTDK
jgi:hypothetical protein